MCTETEKEWGGSRAVPFLLSWSSLKRGPQSDVNPCGQKSWR